MKRHLATFLVVAGTAGLAATQTPASPGHDDFTRLHSAWIKEVLDLDVAGAVADYQTIANDRRPANLERWIAVARLAELSRLGVPTGPRGPLDEAPAQVRTALQLLVPLPDVGPSPTTTPATGAPNANTTRPIDLRPAVPVVQNWVRKLVGPSLSARSLQRWQAANARPQVDSRAMEQARQAYDAQEVLRSELEGRSEQAQSRRELLFRDWKPPVIKDDPTVALERVRTNLAAWLADPDLSAGRRERLVALRDEIQHRSATSAAAALDFVLRLPWIAERLLAEPGTTSDRR